MDGALKKAVKVNPADRYEAHSKFIIDLNTPNPKFHEQHRIPLIERNPILFWKSLSGLLAFLVIILLYLLAQ